MLERMTICVCLQVKRIVIHPKYDPATTNNDVALLKLKDKIDFSKFDGTVAPICIPQQLRAYTGQTVRAFLIKSSFSIKTLADDRLRRETVSTTQTNFTFYIFLLMK